MEISEARRLREMEKENSELKKMVAEQALDIRILKDVNGKKMVAPSNRAQASGYLERGYHASERWACEVLGLNGMTKRNLEQEKPQCAQEQRVIELSAQKDRWGYRKVHDLMMSPV